ncbi:hypothetical protein ACM66B_006223 [Microbotryomycetes sp. NB124-2]
MVRTALWATAALATAGIASYAPEYVPCPTDGTGLRLSGVANVNQSLNPLEQTYTNARKQVADAAMTDWITRNNLVSVVFGDNSVVNTSLTLPKLALSASGGGFRASVVGAAWLDVLDGRNNNGTKGLQGLLQSATYMSGLSGGSLLLASVILNEMPDLYELVQGPVDNSTTGSWNLDFDLLQPQPQPLQYLQSILGDVGDKRSAGDFNVTLVDVFARGLSYHFLPGTSPNNFFSNESDHGSSITWSSAATLSTWQNHSLPFPIIAIQSYSVNAEFNPSAFATGITLSNTNYEATPIEFGSFDGKLSTFVATEYLGTPLDGGQVSGSDGLCVKNFDNAGFIIGCSSNIFPAGNRTDEEGGGLLDLTDPTSPIALLLNVFNSTFGTNQPSQQLDVGAVPNPFKGLRVGEYEDSDQDQLRLVDGGFGGEGAPVSPLLVKPRQVDAIIVVDSSDNNNVTGAPSGGTLIATQVRSQILGSDVLAIPPLPANLSTYATQNLTKHPVFYGCQNDTQTTTTNLWPIIIYVPNFDEQGITNSSTLELSYSKLESGVIFNRSREIFSNGKPSARHEWVDCVGCALLDGVRRQSGASRSLVCSECFEDYCWNGVETTGDGDDENDGGEEQGGGNGNNSTVPDGASGNGGQQPVSAAAAMSVRLTVFCGTLIAVAVVVLL